MSRADELALRDMERVGNANDFDESKDRHRGCVFRSYFTFAHDLG